jgi:hypothetical protein
MSSEREKIAKRQATKWFFVLLIVGLALGGLLAVGVVQVLGRFGLDAKPDHPLRIVPYQKPTSPPSP